jgi:two-component system chemotaxis response regulator CheB
MEVLKHIVAQLPCDFPGTVFIVWHVSPTYPSMLPQILQRLCSLPVAHAIDEEAIEPGRVYIAPPDHHLIVEQGQVRVTRGPKENRFRPSVDVLFRSAALAYGAQVIGVVLTGSLDDGAAGMYAIKNRGGIGLVQDPFEALYPSMPIQTMKAAKIDYCLPMKEIGALLVSLVNEAVEKREENPVSDQMEMEVAIAREDNAFGLGIMKLGEPSPYTCPECHGVLLKLKEGNFIRFRCHTGHAYSLNTLLAEVTKYIEDKLWGTLRAIEESQLLMSHMAEHMREENDNEMAELFLQKSEEANKRSELIRQALMSHEMVTQEKLNSQRKNPHSDPFTGHYGDNVNPPE